ncbi:MAG: ABC transporter permease [Saprospiraceae bacterium]|nr:ABC transporter permease [Saprospiraceae bacterium]
MSSKILKFSIRISNELFGLVFRVLVVVMVVYFLAGIISDRVDIDDYPASEDKIESNLPMFYFSVLPSWYDHRLELTSRGPVKKQGIAFLKQGIDYSSWLSFQRDVEQLASMEGYREVNRWRYIRDTSQIKAEVSQLINNAITKEEVKETCLNIEKSLKVTDNGIFRWMPTFHWWGTGNAFHKDFSTFFSGTGKWYQLKSAMALSFILSFFAYLFSIAGGTGLALMYMQLKPGMKRFWMIVFNFVYVFPIFCLAVLAVQFFTSDYYIPFLNIFPGPARFLLLPSTSFWGVLTQQSGYFILPAFLIALPLSCGIAMHWIAGMEEDRKKPYVLTLQSKGLTGRRIYFRHILRNVSLPMIVYFSMLLPALMSGVLLIENVFAIGGVGRLSWQSVRNEDFIMLLVITAIVATINSLMNSFGKWLLIRVDPRTKSNPV